MSADEKDAILKAYHPDYKEENFESPFRFKHHYITSSLDSDISTQKETMDPVLDLIVSEIPAPNVNVDGSLQFQGCLLDYNDYVGRMAIGRIQRGHISVGEVVSCMRTNDTIKQFIESLTNIKY